MPSALDLDLDLAFDRPWFPGLAERLVAPALAQRGLSSATYSTGGWLNLTGSAFENSIPGEWPLALLQPVPPALDKALAALGLRFAGAPEAEQRTLFEAAWACLAQTSEVAAAARSLVLAVHLLQPSGPGYDVSHSDPDLPCSVFLSLPVGEPHAVLRAAESIVHEAMHLQLTLLEADAPIVEASTATGYSPWQQRDRPIAGLVHGLYVFVVIDAWLAHGLAAGRLDPQSRSFAEKRRREIAGEIDQVRGLAGHEALTAFGRRFVARLLTGPAPRRPQVRHSPASDRRVEVGVQGEGFLLDGCRPCPPPRPG